MSILVSFELLEAGRSNQGFTPEQFEVLGIDYPPIKNWKESLVGTYLSDASVLAFLHLKRKHETPVEKDILAPRSTSNYVLTFDGSCLRNPGGPMGFGFHLNNGDGDLIFGRAGAIESHAPFKLRTNNVAELSAALEGLKYLDFFRKHNSVKNVLLRGDSELAVYGISGRRKMRKSHLYAIAKECQILIRSMKHIKFHYEWIPREQNKQADRLSNEGSHLDSR